jgi:DNA invertase Pin-like site-specific DNA recombinase
MSATDRPKASRTQHGANCVSSGNGFGGSKILAHHHERLAVVYIRQSTPRQVQENIESTALQYQLARRAVGLGWREDRVLIIDDDLGQSAATATHRIGFQRLLAEVGLNHVGLVLGIEMSRLARSCKDWYQLLELCAVFRTLLADQDGVYDPTGYNDRLLLGLKGTMSEAELHVIRSRLDQGKRHKAQRGELITRLPVGYVFLPSGEVAMDPDQQVQAVVRLIFDKFIELGSGGAVVRYLHRSQIRVPVRPINGRQTPPLQWRPPTHGAIYAVLNHPLYAGAYAYGRRPVDLQRKQVNPSQRSQITVPMDQWQVLLPDHLPAYITWDQYLLNRERLRQNVSRWDTTGAPRRGAALLGGLVYCGRCGHRMQVHYAGAHRACYGCNRVDRNGDCARCPGLAAGPLDALVSRHVLRALEPASLELSLRAHEDLERERQRLHQHWQQQLERARYQADRARRQYELVEPENRLVVRELEKEWEGAMVQLRQQEEEYARFRRDLPCGLSRAEREIIRALAGDIPQIWNSSTTTPEDRQIVIRQLVDRIRVRVDGSSEAATVAIHWKGGSVTEHSWRRSVRRYRQLDAYDRLLGRIQELRADGQTGPAIASALNAENYRTAKGLFFTAGTVRTLLSRQGLSRSRTALEHPEGCGRDEWWVGDLARELGASINGVKGWIARGWVNARQLRGGGRYWIVWADADEVERLRRLLLERRTPYSEELTAPKARPGRRSRSAGDAREGRHKGGRGNT